MESTAYGRRTVSKSDRPAIWGGVECTVNRVGDEYFDQIERSGHAFRLDDLRAFAELGIRTLRFPLLWERTCRDGLTMQWEWSDERMNLMHELGIEPIVGLVHHGSGPRITSLLDPNFATRLAVYARAVAERYPWVQKYTPINEPLTTARFSGLYGYWHPHASDDCSFARALVNQCSAVALAMRAIRDVNPNALLIQTEDLGRTHGTPALDYQARFENDRRWVTFDLLAGLVGDEHPMSEYLRSNLQSDHELGWLRDNPTSPDVLGLNYYVTSERFIDERISHYPECAVGGNHRDRYVDVEAIRVLTEGCDGVGRLATEAWERYHIPIAITEAHLGCGRAEQLRWFREIYNTCSSVRESGVDIRAVTAWALLGTYDWHNLVTRSDGVYESGVFDVRGGTPRPTALAHMIRTLIRGKGKLHPVASQPGWWQRPSRLQFPPVDTDHSDTLRTARSVATCSVASRMPTIFRLGVSDAMDLSRPLVITGARGTLGQAFAVQCRVRGIPFRLLSRTEMDIADGATVEHVLRSLSPWAVVNAAGFVLVDDAESDESRCFRDNTDGPATLASVCAGLRIPFVTFSTDLVFDGVNDKPYVESVRTAPLNAYGRSKASAEIAVSRAHPRSLIVRTSAFFGPIDEHNFVTRTLRSLLDETPVYAADDAIISPTYVPDLVDETLNLLIDDECGIWHLANDGAITWFDLARRVAHMAELDVSLVAARSTDSFVLPAPRPRYTPLATERGQRLSSLDNALDRYMRESTIARDITTSRAARAMNW